MRKPRQWQEIDRSVVLEHPLVDVALVQVAPEAQSGEEVDVSTSRNILLIESNDWVNIVAVDNSEQQERLILIRQWRFGCSEDTLEIPGGLVDDGENPEDAARRELLEETGYACGVIERLGVIQPNPALFNNRCHLFLARDLEFQAPPTGDGDEEIEVLLRPLPEVAYAIGNGEIQHALVIAALHFYDRWRSTNGAQPLHALGTGG